MTSNQRRPGSGCRGPRSPRPRKPQAAEVAAAEPRNGRGWRCGSQRPMPSAPRRRRRTRRRRAPRRRPPPSSPMRRPPMRRRRSRQGRRARARACTVRDGASSSRGRCGCCRRRHGRDRRPGFMRDLVEAMRRVAEETRQSGLSDLRTKSEEQVRRLEAEAERRREELEATRRGRHRRGRGVGELRDGADQAGGRAAHRRSPRAARPAARRRDDAAPRRKPRPSAIVSQPTSASSTPTTLS